jgi:hypothetical protein
VQVWLHPHSAPFQELLEEGNGLGFETAPFPSFSTVEALRAWPHERNSKIAYMEAVDFIDVIFEFLKKEGWLRDQINVA